MTGRVRVFFYGSFISVPVLEQGGMTPRGVQVARLHGWDLQIGPLANVIPAERGLVYGIVCDATHDELATLYGQEWVGAYLPEAVIVELRDGGLVPALCYVAAPQSEAPPEADYVDRIAGAARQHGFPAWYLERVESFRRN